MKTLEFKDFYFDIGCFTARHNKIPEKLPFILEYNEKEKIIKQRIKNTAKKALKLYYELGGYASTPLGEGDYGKRQAQDVFNFIEISLKKVNKKINKTSFLEIGASYGYLLYLLRKNGAKEVLGIEPGNEGIVGSKKYKVKMIKEFFPCDLPHAFDFIYSYGTLEHIENPLVIITKSLDYLNNKGVVFVAAPDSEKKMAVGDISIISHQHLNYFTKNSLSVIFKRAGFKNIKIINSKSRSMLIGWAEKGIKEKNIKSREEFGDNSCFSDEIIFKNFNFVLEKNIRSIQQLIDNNEKMNKTLGLYGPCSSLISLLKFKKEPRIFDIDEKKHGKFITGCASHYEQPGKLIDSPVDVLIIIPIDYDKEIRNNLKKMGIRKKTKIISLKKIYERNSGLKYNIGN